jgi:hypothetical protein
LINLKENSRTDKMNPLARPVGGGAQVGLKRLRRSTIGPSASGGKKRKAADNQPVQCGDATNGNTRA